MAVLVADEAHRTALIGAIYEAAGDTAAWPVLAGTLAHAFDAESCLLQTADPALPSTIAQGVPSTTVLGVTANMDAGFSRDYQAHYFQHDQWAAGAARFMGQAMLGHEVAPAEWYQQSPMLNELCRRAGAHSLVGGGIGLGAGGVAMIGIHRPRDRPGFDDADKRWMGVLLPHVGRAMALGRRLGEAALHRGLSAEALDRTGSAVLAVDGQGRVLLASALAEALLREPGSGVCLSAGRIGCTERHAGARLAALIRSAGEAATGAMVGGGGMAVPRGPSRLPLTLLVAPLRGPFDVAGGRPVLVFLRDPEAATVGRQVLQELFGLTPAQAAVAARLARGQSQAEIAEGLMISQHTVRDHIKVVFAKTGMARQSQLVALLAATVAANAVDMATR